MPTSTTPKRRKTTSPRRFSDLPVVDNETSPIDDAVGYNIGDKAVNLPQLQNEIEQASGQDSTNFATTAEPDGDVILWISPASISASVISTCVADHVPNPNWGVPKAILDFQNVLARVQDDPESDLTNDDVKALVKGFALSFPAMLNRS